MCMSGSQPAAPVNPAAYSLEQSEKAVTQTQATEPLTMDTAKDTSTPKQAKDTTAATVAGGSGLAM